MFRTCCCLRAKCKRSYLLIYITSGSYINKLCKQVKRPIPLEILALKIATKQLQLATWLYWQPIGTYQRPIQRYHRRPSTTYRLACKTLQTDRRQTDRTSYHKRDRTTQYGRLIKTRYYKNSEIFRDVLHNMHLYNVFFRNILSKPIWIRACDSVSGSRSLRFSATTRMCSIHSQRYFRWRIRLSESCLNTFQNKLKLHLVTELYNGNWFSASNSLWTETLTILHLLICCTARRFTWMQLCMHFYIYLYSSRKIK